MGALPGAANLHALLHHRYSEEDQKPALPVQCGGRPNENRAIAVLSMLEQFDSDVKIKRST
jgi:hypothetical protein